MKQNLYYVANARIPTDRAHGIQIMKMCEAFAKVGWTVTLVVPQRRNPIQDDPFDYHGVSHSFTITRLFAGDVAGSGRVWFLWETLVFSLSAFLFLLFAPRGIVYSRDEIPASTAVCAGRRVFWESHTGSWNIPARLLAQHAKGIVLISEGLRDFYASHGISKEHMLVAHDAVDPAASSKETKEKTRGRYDIPRDVFLIVYTGRLAEEKGIYTLLEASTQFPAGILLAVAGEGDDVFPLRAKYPHVLFLGHIPPKEARALQEVADLLVIPNSAKHDVSKMFTSPMKLFEYFASGVPILASDVPAIRAIAQNAEVLWFMPDDANDLAAKVSAHAQNPLPGKDAARKAQASLVRFTWDVRANVISEFINPRGTMNELKNI